MALATLVRVALSMLMISLLPLTVSAQVTFERLLTAADEPQNWLTYSGGYDSQRQRVDCARTI